MQKTKLGYPVLSDDLRNKVFGKDKSQEMTRLSKQKAESLLNRFGIPTPVDHPDHLYNGSLPLPNLRGDYLKEHFETVATDQIGQYKEWANQFSTCSLPPLPPPEVFVFEPGWTRYTKTTKGEWVTEYVEYPLEDAFTYDTETFVKGGAFPIIGTAVSEKAVYVWLAKETIHPETPEEEWDQHDLIPIGTNRFVVGHNISYDRVRAREGYNLNKTRPENFYFDTLSAHMAYLALPVASAGYIFWLIRTLKASLLRKKES